jgi:WD40 repeat protein
VWDLASEDGRLLNTLEGHTSPVSSVAVTPDGTKIVSGSYDNTIRVWDIASGGGRLLNTLEGHSSPVMSVAITPDGTKIVSGSRDRTIKVWDLNNGSTIFGCKFDSTVSTIAISNNKNTMAVGDSNGGVYVIDFI